jgi:dihydrolipoamide dehydrogenase
MQEFDALVIGGGTGNVVASAAAAEGYDVALFEKERIGGTCLNRGCTPSKMLIQRASLANTVREAERFGVHAHIDELDVAGFVDAVHTTNANASDAMTESKREQANLTLVEREVRFVDDHTVEDGDGERYTGERVVVAAGARPFVPPIDGLDDVDYLTSREAIRLREIPDELVVLGGGYIAAELGYYFDALGSQVTIVEMLDTLLPREDEDVAREFTEIARGRHEVYTGSRATAVRGRNGRVEVVAEREDGAVVTVAGDELLVAVGRKPNTDAIGLETTGVSVDDAGFVETDDYLRTAVDGVWAMGDIADNSMFKHTADYEADLVVENVFRGGDRPADFDAVPHAIFTEPQVGGVGRTEEELREAGVDYVVGTAQFSDTSMARALELEEGFVKVLAAPSGEILGVHILGHEASVLVHEAVVAVKHGLSVYDVAETIHAHPALSKVVREGFADAAAAVDGRR